MSGLHRWLAAVLLLPALLSGVRRGNGDTIDKQFQAAAAHYNAGQYAAAQHELEPLAKALPNSFDVQELLALVYSAEGHEEKATPLFERAVRLRPKSGPARNNLAANLARLGKSERAEKEFKKVVELEPKSYDANHNLGEFYARLGKIAAAIPYLENAQRENPSAYDNGYDLALAEEQTGRVQDARQEIQSLLKQRDSAELHNLLAEVDEQSGDFVAAVNEYETSAHMDPSESNLFDWGSELLVHQTPEPAIAVFSAGAKLYPKSARLAVGLGMALYLKGSFDEAVKSLLRAIDLNPSDVRAYDFLSKAYDRSPSQADAVIERFRHFAELRPRNPQAALDYAMSLWKGKRTETSSGYLDQVESLLHKAVSLDPESAEAHLQLGNLYSQRHGYAQAVPEYQRALSLSPSLPDAHFRLGQAYTRLGQKELAQKEFQLHQRLYEQHLAAVDKQRSEIKQFVFSMKGTSAGR